MTPLKTHQEVLVAQEACYEAWRQAQSASGLRRLQLVHRAFPHAVQGATDGQLFIAWSEKHQLYSIADFGGFLTLATNSELKLAIAIESASPGKFRQVITGVEPEKKEHSRVFSMDFEPAKSKRPKKTKGLTLSDLGL